MEGVAAGPSGAPAAMPAGQVPRPSAPAVYGGAPVLMPMGAMQGMHPMAAMQQQAHMQAQLHAAFMQQQAAAAAAATGALHPSRQVLMPQAPGQQGGPGAQNL